LVIEGTFESTRPLAAGANSWVLSGKVAPRFKEAAVFTFGSALEGPDAMNRRAELTTRHELMLYVISEPPDSNAL
jgi:hypothetical protein